MKHPILSGKGYQYYLAIWVNIIGAHVAILYFNFQQSFKASVLDSLLYNFLFLGLGFGLWYVVYFSITNKLSILNLIVNHLLAAGITISLWLFFTRSILEKLLASDAEYLLFLEGSLILRGLIGLFFYSMIIIIYYLMDHYQRLQMKTSEEHDLRTKIKEAELKMLKSQINPHFIFNSLNSINALTISAPEKASDMVVKLSDYLRYSIGKDDRESNSLREELENITLYLEIEKVRFGKRLNLDMSIEENCNKAQVPNMILQPLVENTIKYGINESLETINIGIKCSKKNSDLIIVISNNYDPDSTITSEGEGVGLKNIQDRLMLTFGKNDLISVVSRDYVFEVTLIIPQIQGHD
ncbi:MAG: histidine kinase [Bacteroidetes bacterium]|nr:MAG: histidine kinase [Bacteroidota bacterium]